MKTGKNKASLMKNIEENIDISNIDQVRLFSDILSETTQDGKFEKLILLCVHLLTQVNSLRKKPENNFIEEQNTRLINLMSFFISFLQSLSCEQEIFELFLASPNFSTNFRLIPKEYIENQITLFKDFAKTNKMETIDLPNFQNTRIEDVFDIFSGIKLLKNQIEDSADIEEIRHAFQELCGMFELSNVINSLLIQKYDQNSKISNESTEHKQEIKRLNDKMLETELVLRNTVKLNKKLQKKLKEQENNNEVPQLKLQLKKSSEIIRSLQNDQQQLQIKLAKTESNRVDIAKLRSDNDDMAFKIIELNDQLKETHQNYQNVKQAAKILKQKLMKNKDKFTQLKERYDLIKQTPKDNTIFTYIAMIAESLGTKIGGIDLKTDVDHICKFSSNLKRTLVANSSPGYPLKQKFDSLTKDIIEYEEYARNLSLR